METEVLMEGRVMVLPITPSKQEVKDYLNWLAGSVFAYHIDDDVSDIVWDEVPGGATSEEISQLTNNAMEMWVYDAQFLWDNYPWKEYMHRNEIAQELFGVNYNQLGVSGKWDVDDKLKNREDE